MSIEFEVYKDGRRLTAYTPRAASAMGPESVPVAGEVRWRDGLLCIERHEHALGLSLLWDTGAFGELHLETCRLPSRGRPYVLNVELARLRLMKILQKLEDWNLYDFPGIDVHAQRLVAVRSQFAEALGKLSDPAAASVIADQTLTEALRLSEDLAHFHAELLLNRRKSVQQFPRHLFGCRVDWRVQNQAFREALCNSVDFAVLPMGWKLLQPAEDRWNVEELDGYIELLHRKRIPVIGGPLVELTEDAVPEWMFLWEHDYETLRDLAFEYVKRVVQRYRKAVTIWNVVAGIHAAGAFGLTFEQMIELTRLLVAEIKNLVPGARTLVTIRQPYGEYHAIAGKGVPPMLYAELIAQGVNFEAFGLEVEMGVPVSGCYTRDLFQFSCMLDRFAHLGKPVFLTAVGVPGRNSPDPRDNSNGINDPSLSGRWHEVWSPQQQAEWMEQVAKIALSKPFVESFAWNNLADIRPRLPAGGLLDDSLRPKPVMEKFSAMRQRFAHPKAKPVA